MQILEITLLLLAAIAAGFIDSIVGGGGLLQVPALLLAFPQQPVVNLLATNKWVSIVGTSFASYRFAKVVPIQRDVILPAVISAFIFALGGATTLTWVSNSTLKPICLVLMVAAFIFMIRSSRFGITEHIHGQSHALWKPIFLGAALGFYDGFFGPGTGSFLIIGLVGLMGLNLIQASAHSKIINAATNAGAILIFSLKAQPIWKVALPMIACNLVGSHIGVKFAVLKGNRWVLIFLRAILAATILKLGYDVLAAR